VYALCVNHLETRKIINHFAGAAGVKKGVDMKTAFSHETAKSRDSISIDSFELLPYSVNI
jgi:hypothetical protein